jgi:hypothetical protein
MKQMHRVEGGETVDGRRIESAWVMLCTNLPPVVVTRQKVIGRLVASFYDSEARPVFAAASAAVNPQNAEFRRLAAEGMRSASRRS